MMPVMKQFEDISKTYQAAMPHEMTGAVNLLAHPAASVAATGALGFGIASHAFGLWMGTLAGMAEASRRMMVPSEETVERGQPRSPAAPKLALVETTPPVQSAAAAARTMVAEAEGTARKVAETARKATDAVLGDAIAASKPRKASVQAISAARPAAQEKPPAPDDLKAIAGIGPKLEKVLNDLGIWTYAQVDGLTDAEIAWLDETLGFAGRIGRDDWLGQAKALSRK
jgi:NADH-quinone oxidoreductase subunit E